MTSYNIKNLKISGILNINFKKMLENINWRGRRVTEQFSWINRFNLKYGSKITGILPLPNLLNLIQENRTITWSQSKSILCPWCNDVFSNNYYQLFKRPHRTWSWINYMNLIDFIISNWSYRNNYIYIKIPILKLFKGYTEAFIQRNPNFISEIISK